MNSADLKFFIIDLLQKEPAYHQSRNGVQHYVRCPFCGDSRNVNHSHLSIKIDTDNENEPMLYRCLKCNSSGLVSNTFLEELDIFIESSVKRDLKLFGRKSMKINRLVNNDMEKYSVPLYSNDHVYQSKLEYLNSRLGIQVSLNTAKDYKIILNLFDFIKFNEIDKNPNLFSSLSYSMMKNLNNNYIGFLSTNNNCIIFRDITGKQKYRYFKVVINEKNVNQDSFYSLPSKISLMYTNDINIHITEGIFDILSVKENVIKESINNYYYAMCGFGGLSILKYVIRHGMTTGITLHIYSDNDKYDWEHKRYLSSGYISEWLDNVLMHRNTFKNEKDYGVPSHQIIDTSYKLL